MQIVKHYRENETLRRSFCRLAQETFGIDFESWYRKGFWTDCYEPYSVLVDGEIVANVSVNRTDMVFGGRQRKLVQLGTVMTKPEYRNRGYIRAIMAEIDRDISDAEGIYLFANDSVRAFYPKFGFEPGVEELYTRQVEQTGEPRMIQVPMFDPTGWERLAEAMKMGEPASACAMADNPGLIFFYVAGFMQENVYYAPELNAWAIAELEEEELLLHNVFGPEGLALEDVIGAFGSKIRRVTLGFAPANPEGWTRQEYHEEDCTFFVRGDVFREFEQEHLRIPSLSHA